MLPFYIPPTRVDTAPPQWDGLNFVFDGQRTPVLEYSENFAGWSDDLTALHEEAAGDSHPVDLASRYDALQQVSKYLPSTQSVIMEIGCSSGFLLNDLVKKFPKTVLIGADVVKEPLYRLAKSLPGIPLLRFDLLKCPLPDNSVDVLIMLNVLEHIEHDVDALKKAFNLLKPGGALIVEVPAGPALYDAYDAELQHFRRYSPIELQNKLKQAGFIVTRRSHLGFLLFPAFAAVKLINKWRHKKNTAIVRQQAANTSASWLVKIAMMVESKFLSGVHLPFGIRCQMTAIKAK